MTQIVSWGCLYYGFAALQSSIIADTGWSGVAVTGAFSLSQLVSGGVGIWVGRHLDRYGPRAVMTGAVAVAVPGMALVALAPSLAWFYAGWVRRRRRHGRRALPARVRGAHPVGRRAPGRGADRGHARRRARQHRLRPAATAVEQAAGWRAAYLVLLAWSSRHAAAALVGAPTGRGGRTPTTRVDGHDRSRRRRAPVTRSRAFVVLTAANALTALAVFAVVVNLVPMLLRAGHGAPGWPRSCSGWAAWASSSAGWATPASPRPPRSRPGRCSSWVPWPVATAAFALAPQAVLVVALGMLLGLARGVYTLVQATAVTDRWGPRSYGRLNGVLTAPALVASALAPFAGAALADLLGSYAAAFLVLAGVAAVAAVLMLGAAPVGVSGARSGLPPAG